VTGEVLCELCERGGHRREHCPTAAQALLMCDDCFRRNKEAGALAVQRLEDLIARAEGVHSGLRRAQQQVADFHRAFRVPQGGRPELRNGVFRAALIWEEALETMAAIAENDLTEAVDGLCDLIYVCLGAACEWGVDLQPLFDEVHATNMAKMPPGPQGGKVRKPHGWQPPRIAELLRLQEQRV
jgi:hypothetical protein